MSSLYWYISLAVVGVATGAFAIYSKRYVYKMSTLIMFYLFATSITWIGEFVMLGALNGYAYKPGVFTDPWAENIAGHLILNSTLWPGAATLVVAYSLEIGWCSLIVAFFIFAEYLFMTLGIYEQYWWRYYMSAIIVVIFLSICKIWFAKMQQTHNRFARKTIMYFVAFVIIHFPHPLLLLFGKQYYSVGLITDIFSNLYRSSTIFILLYHLIDAFIWVYFVCILDKWIWKLVPVGISFAVQLLLIKTNILIFQGGWNLLYLNLVYVACWVIFILIDKYTLKPRRI